MPGMSSWRRGLRGGQGDERSTPASDTQIVQAGELRSARIESLRAIAALAVLVGHVFGQAYDYNRAETFATFMDRVLLGGGFGVFLFFTLSGYLLFWPFAKRAFGGGDTIDLRRYAINRAVRILPLYYVVVVAVLVIQEGGGTFGEWWRFLLFAENFSIDTVGKVNGVLWSLVVELHFYLLLPVFAVVLGRLSRGSLRLAFILLLGAGAASYVWRLYALDLGGNAAQLWRYSLPTTFWFFVSGMVIALIRIAWQDGPPRWLFGPLRWSSVWLLAAIPFWLLVFDDYDNELAVATAGFLMVGACVLPLKKGVLVRVLEWKPLAVVGIASYSLYLWHVPILNQLVKPSLLPDADFPTLLLVAGPLCIAWALLSYRFIEAPFLRLRKRWARSAPAHVDSEAPARDAAPGEPQPALR